MSGRVTQQANQHGQQQCVIQSHRRRQCLEQANHKHNKKRRVSELIDGNETQQHLYTHTQAHSSTRQHLHKHKHKHTHTQHTWRLESVDESTLIDTTAPPLAQTQAHTHVHSIAGTRTQRHTHRHDSTSTSTNKHTSMQTAYLEAGER